ncbi:MAG: NAD(P)/FAD-dependent oxidoreductase [Solirubrobacterales bacterium]|nr:NAD(P)/FAD-dependent oxidoreductase [Solirubrobacterales bacterium]
MKTAPDFDVLIVGAGVSGIGLGCHLERTLPSKSYAVLEARDQIGGTWDLFRYPGIRSDSDLHTFGFAFKPWTDKESIASGEAIRTYLCEAAAEYGVDRQIRFGHKTVRAAWSTADALWTVESEVIATGEKVVLTARWLFCATGYYSYEQGHTPDFEGIADFDGPVVHPQHWPQSLDYTDKRVVVIGSGATAVTLVPAMAAEASHVTMLQRSPTYVVAVPAQDALANFFKRHLSPDRAYALTRRRNIRLQRLQWSLSQRYPRQMKWLLIKLLRRNLPQGYDVATHFTPTYNPWDQRLCSVPDGDLFKAISDGSASVVTDRIKAFTKTGLLLESGDQLDADVVVTATGLDMLAFGGIETTIDGELLDISKTIAYRGMMLTSVPNFTYAIGYTNASWTLKVDLVCHYLCRVLAHMDSNGFDECVPVNNDPGMKTRPLLDFQAGYVQRSLHLFPREGEREPWELSMNYRKDRKTLRDVEIEDGLLNFSRSRHPVAN